MAEADEDEINLESLKLLKEIFEVNQLRLQGSGMRIAAGQRHAHDCNSTFMLMLCMQVTSMVAAYLPCTNAELLSRITLLTVHGRQQMRMAVVSLILMSSVPSWAPTWVSTSSGRRWHSCS